MTKIALEYKRLSPSVSVAKIKDTEKNVINWRHRYILKNKTLFSQDFKNYPLEDFNSLPEFTKFIESLPINKHQIL